MSVLLFILSVISVMLGFCLGTVAHNAWLDKKIEEKTFSYKGKTYSIEEKNE